MVVYGDEYNARKNGPVAAALARMAIAGLVKSEDRFFRNEGAGLDVLAD